MKIKTGDVSTRKMFLKKAGAKIQATLPGKKGDSAPVIMYPGRAPIN
jgi:hypothetical protein